MKNREPISQLFGARAYGCLWRSAFPLPLFQPADAADPMPDQVVVRVSQAQADAPERPFEIANGRMRLCADGLRYVADDGTLIDVYGANRMEIAPGDAWDGEAPAAFYGTATAALLAARGELPMHGSAVEVGGRVVLLCGHSGAGKSTLTAALIAAGARLVSDDLSGIQMGDSEDEILLYSGRRAIRLFPDVAGFLGEKVPIEVVRHPGEPKILAMPPTAATDRALPLAAVVILGEEGLTQPPEMAGLKLLEFSFRRRAFFHLPGFERRAEIARHIARTVPLLPMQELEARSSEQFRAVAGRALRKLALEGIQT